MAVQWRVGNKIPKNLYKGDLDVGRMDTAELAAEVVATMNGVDLPIRAFITSGEFQRRLTEELYRQLMPQSLTQAVEMMISVVVDVMLGSLKGL